jgi:hypothetical protein
MEAKSEKKQGNLRGNVRCKWDWDLIERLLMSGKTNKEIIEMPEFKGMTYAYLKNKAAKLGLHRKRAQIAVMSEAQVDRSIASYRTQGIEEHHIFTFETLEKMREAIRKNGIGGKTSELRAIFDLIQRYVTTATEGYGLKGQSMDAQHISLQAMVSLHVTPPPKVAEDEVIDIAPADFQPVEETPLSENDNLDN